MRARLIFPFCSHCVIISQELIIFKTSPPALNTTLYHANHQLPESDHMATHTKKLFFHLLSVNVKKTTTVRVTVTGEAFVLLAAPEFQRRPDAF